MGDIGPKEVAEWEKGVEERLRDLELASAFQKGQIALFHRRLKELEPRRLVVRDDGSAPPPMDPGGIMYQPPPRLVPESPPGTLDTIKRAPQAQDLVKALDQAGESLEELGEAIAALHEWMNARWPAVDGVAAYPMGLLARIERAYESLR